MTKYLRKISTPSKVGSTKVIDSLNSTSKTDALSADAGRELNEKIKNITSLKNYSTEEVIIGKWIDGRPIYRKVVNVGSGSGNFTYPHGISNLDTVVNAYGNFLQGSTREPLPKTTFANSSPGWSAHIDDFTNTTFSLHFGTGIGTATKICVVIEYTKTTD